MKIQKKPRLLLAIFIMAGTGCGSGNDANSNVPDMSVINPCELVTLAEAQAIMPEEKELKMGNRSSMTSRVVMCSITSPNGIPKLMTQLTFRGGLKYEQMMQEDGYELIKIAGHSLDVGAVFQEADPKLKIDRQLFQVGVIKDEYLLTLTPTSLKIVDHKSDEFKQLVDLALKAASRLK